MNKTRSLVCTVLLMLGLSWKMQPAFASGHGDVTARVRHAASQEMVQGAEGLPGDHSLELPEGLLSAVGELVGSEKTIEPRIASILQKLGKILVLESTRGAKEVELYRRAAPAVVLVVTDEGLGSGAILGGQGHVITNWHVVGANPHVVVVFKPKDSTDLTKALAFWATVEKIDQVADLALLKIKAPPKTLASLPLGDGSSLAVGQDVHAIGHPEGEVWTYTKGIISQIRPNYTWSASEDIVHRAKVIQTQTPINPGSSGGPLLDDSGRLIGINSFRSSGEGLNYAVAVDEIQAFLKRERSRVSSPRQLMKPQCKEAYDTTGQGWTNIVGCYLLRIAPPPDLWLVYWGPKGPLAYGALGSQDIREIDTVVVSRDRPWKGLEHFMDVDCDGTIDLIGYQSQESEDIESYRAPEKTLRLVTLAKELDSAVKRRKIPYSTVRVCQ